jgi:hypothetical protein
VFRYYVRNGRRELTKLESTSFSVVQREDGWFWCSDAAWETRGTEALIGPFASREEAEQDANEALGIVGNGRA